MAIDPSEIELNEVQRRQLAEMAEKTGRPWNELLSEAMHRVALDNSGAVTRLRQILDSLSHGTDEIPSAELNALIEEASQYARHGRN